MTTNQASGKIKASRVNNLDAATYVGPAGQLWYDVDTGVLRLGDNVTPGGTVVSSGTSNSIYNGTSNVNIPVANGDVTVSTNSISNAAVFSQGSLYLQGPVVTPKLITNNIIIKDGFNAIMAAPFVIADGASITLDDNADLVVIYGN
jgi:hypothetical protein